MEAPSSFVSKARTAFHSAAAKAERVFTDIKSDFIPDRSDSDKVSPKEGGKQVEAESPKIETESKSNSEGKHSRWRPANIGTKQEWQDRFKNIRIGKRGAESPTERIETMGMPFYDENFYLLNLKNEAEARSLQPSSILERLNATNPDTIPSTSILKQLAVAVEAGKKYKSMKDILASSGGSSPIKERASLSLAAVKSLVLRDKEDKLMKDILASSGGSSPIKERASLSLAAVKSLVLRDKEDKLAEFGNDEKLLLLIQSLFDAEGNFLRRNIGSGSEALSFPRDIHGSPPESFLVKLSEVMGNFKTLQKMSLVWCKIVAEIRRLWYEEELHIPGIPLDGIPDLNSCLLYQKLQVINCCVSRKRRLAIASESIESVMKDANSCSEDSAVLRDASTSSSILYARISTGELVLRLGVGCRADGLNMLKTGEPIYSPITQEGPLLTEDLIKETEEFVLRTGSVGAGCSQLLSDMQAFKAANPGCILEDFVRWHSPPDWTESSEANEFFNGSDSSCTIGQLSNRMQKAGNLWRELWETSKPVPAIKQAPLYDEDLQVEAILNDLEEMPPFQLFEQLFISLLGLGFVMGEAKLPKNNDLSKLFYESKDYVVATCQGHSWSEKVEDLCQAYQTMETMLLDPDEVLKTLKQIVDNPREEPRRLFKRLGLNFGRKLSPRDEKNSEENSAGQPLSNFFDSKSSLFGKKPPKPETTPQGDKTPSPDENDWTLL